MSSSIAQPALQAVVLAASLVSFCSIPLAGHLSNRFGRPRIYIVGAIATGVFGWVYFAMLDTLVPFWIFAATVLSLIPHDIMYGPQSALIAGGPAPLIAAALFATYRSWVAISVYFSICAMISVMAAALMRDYTGLDISEEYAFDKA